MLEIPGLSFDVAFAGRDGRWLAISGDRGTEVWDVTARKKVTRNSIPFAVLANQFRRRRLSLRDDGRLLATIDRNNQSVSVWEGVTGTRRTTTRRHQSEVLAVTFTPDGKRVLATLADWSVHEHPLEIPELLALAKTRVTRSLTAEECERYLGRRQCPAIE